MNEYLPKTKTNISIEKGIVWCIRIKELGGMGAFTSYPYNIEVRSLKSLVRAELHKIRII